MADKLAPAGNCFERSVHPEKDGDLGAEGPGTRATGKKITDVSDSPAAGA